MSLNQLHSSERVHIVFVGRTNSGKSSVINALTDQKVSIVSPEAGTTTDAVRKVIEITGVGPCVAIDTAGFDDTTPLGALRVEKTREAAQSADVVVAVISAENSDITPEMEFLSSLPCKNVIYAVNKSDLNKPAPKDIPAPSVRVSAKTGDGIGELVALIKKKSPEKIEESTITGKLVKAGDKVLLVMPQDSSAPKGRLILPQVQVIRELIDKGAVTVCASLESLSDAMEALKEKPALVITDSQVFAQVSAALPPDWLLTSFSVLLAGYKGDIEAFVDGARAISGLKAGSRVLIAEACSHTTTDADIARVKIPTLLRKKINPEIEVEVVSGNDFPEKLDGYDLVIHCGACMFNKAHVMARKARCDRDGVKMTNYGIAIAYLTGILDRVVLP